MSLPSVPTLRLIEVRVLLMSMLLLPTLSIHGNEPPDSIDHHHWGASFVMMPGRAIVMDSYQRKYQKGKSNFAVDLAACYETLPCDSDDYARDYGFPIFNFGLRYSLNHGVTFHRNADPSWGQAEEVDYDSYMGNILSAYAGFERPFFRHRHWMADYQLNFGFSYSHRKYDPNNNIDDELIGSRVLIFFGAGLHLSYYVAPAWALKAGVEYYHHSNGALNRPNKGANFIAPSLAVVYTPAHIEATEPQPGDKHPFSPYWTSMVTVGVGAKTLDEDWQITQFGTSPDSPRYRTAKFHLYPSYTLSAELMRRYARRWASGLGLDLWYATYDDHVREVNAARGHYDKVTPWSIGLSARHAAYYHNWSLQMSLGFYLLRRMGYMAKQQEQRYYEKIGIHHDLGRLRIGVNVKAHRTKADLTEAVMALRIF